MFYRIAFPKTPKKIINMVPFFNFTTKGLSTVVSVNLLWPFPVIITLKLYLPPELTEVI